ncbi:hypothetical protein QJ857_gp0762 [Tupanvirus soda lake]|uniref:adenine phosphoribosyltransferase n=2 Tax=Tupanvirus TaxID=2094720 RepID=A0A6N1NUV3_9VIRU|nr:hypothetical protein QJ857_gp0762 [Tupanvirus soda lake]QKU35286.1 hypothetical protein [Tupanvirus soda lake]
MEFIQLNVFYFLFLVLYYWNINKVFEFLTQKYGNADFVIDFFFKKIYLVNTKQTLKTILSTRTNDLTYIQQNLNRYLGHSKTINCYNSATIEWLNMHSVLKATLNNPNGKIKEYVQKNKHILLEDHVTLNDAVEKFVNKVFSEFNYGPNVDMTIYSCTRQRVLKYLKRFHQSNLVRVPYIGAIWCTILRWYYKDEMNVIVEGLKKIYENSTGALSEFAYAIHKSRIINNVHDVIIETSLLLMLENDFVYSVIIDQLVKPTGTTIDESIYNGFLYPVRYRNTCKQIDSIPKNSMIIYHLLNSKLYFSWGPRACVGQTMVKNDILPVVEEFKQWIKIDTSTNFYKSMRTDNIPIVKDILNYEISLPQDYIRNIPSFKSDNGVIMYDMMSIYSNPFLLKYIVNKIASQTESNIKIIVAPEARALPLAGALAKKLNLPLIVIRKKGKIIGPSYSVIYNKGYTTEPDCFEISKMDMHGANALFVDDGISSGGSAKACMHLVKMCNGTISKIHVIVKHTYLECMDLGVPICSLFTITKY